MTLTEQLKEIEGIASDQARTAYIKMLRNTNLSGIDPLELKRIVKTCDKIGLSLEEFERDVHIVSTLPEAQEKASTEQYHRDMCKRISGQVSDLRNSAPPDPRMRQKHLVKLRQATRLLALNQSLLHQAESARESLKKQSERFWWFNELIASTESE